MRKASFSFAFDATSILSGCVGKSAGTALRGSLKGLGIGGKSTITVYRNFGWREYYSLKSNNMNFTIKNGGFGSKQFWLDTDGLNWWQGTSFSKNFTAKITVSKKALNYGTYFKDVGKYRAISFDSQDALDVFNRSAKIDWLMFK